MSPQLIKYLLIAVFVFLIVGLIVHIAKHGIKLSRPDADQPLFRRPTREEIRNELKWDLIIGGSLVLVFVLLDIFSK